MPRWWLVLIIFWAFPSYFLISSSVHVASFSYPGIIKSALFRSDGRSTSEVAGLYVYPIKSYRGFQVNQVLLLAILLLDAASFS